MFHPSNTKREVQNPKRRMLLTLGITGIAAFVLGKVFGDNESYLLPTTSSPVKETRFHNFVLTESNDEVVLTESSGDPVFIIDKKSFTQ